MRPLCLFVIFFLIQSGGFGQPPVDFPINFEGGTVLNSNFISFSGGTATVEDNPLINADNPSAKVGRMVRTPETVFAGGYLDLTAPLVFTANSTICMKVYTTAAVGTPVVLKLEDGGAFVEITQNTTVSGGWQTVCFDPPGAPTNWDRLTFLFNLPNSGNETYYFDDIEQLAPNEIALPIDFEGGTVANGNFGDFNGGIATVIANPVSGGINTSAGVGRMVRNGGTVFGGATLVISANVDFSIDPTICMKVYTTAPVGTQVSLKMEGTICGECNSGDRDEFTTVTGQWETICFDFTDEPANFDRVVFLFDLGNVGNGSPASTFYFDDIEQPTSQPNEIALPIDFELGAVIDNDLGGIGTGFGGGNGVNFGAATIIDNPEVSGINTSTTVGQIVRHPGSTSAGAYANLVTNLNFDAYPIICMNIFTDAPAGTNVTLRIEDTDSGEPDIDAVAFTTVSGEWEPLCFVYQLAPDAYDRITFLFDFGTAGNGSAASTFLFDDVEQLITPFDFFYTPGSAYFCPGFPVTFTFPGTGDYEWYADAAATGPVVGTGNPFTTPGPIFSNTSYYVRDMASENIPFSSPVDVGPTQLGFAFDLASPRTATMDFTSNIDNGSWHGVDVVSKFISTPDLCTYTVTGRNLTIGATANRTTARTINMSLSGTENAKQEYLFASPVPMNIGNSMQLEVVLTGGSGCRLRSFQLGGGVPTILGYPSTTSAGELTFTGYNAPGLVNNRWMGFDYQVSGDLILDPTLYQVNAIADCGNPLPIELIDFSVRENNGDALLIWTTASELNNDKFLLLRTIDGVEYKTVVIVSGAGNSSTVLNYSFRDRNPEEGLSYYKLRQVDFDGTESDSELVAFKNETSKEFKLFPNPTSRNLTLSTAEQYDQVDVIIYDLSGRVINRLNYGAIENQDFELEGHPGTYFVEILVNGARKAIFNVLKL